MEDERSSAQSMRWRRRDHARNIACGCDSSFTSRDSEGTESVRR
jgi:hypothetical protein